jgi:hypothetical protein
MNTHWGCAIVWVVLAGCSSCGRTHEPAAPTANLPLVLVADVELPGGATRFDYQDIDAEQGHLVLAHMNDASVLVLKLADGSVERLLPNIPTARGVVVGDGRIFITSSPSQVVIVDGKSLHELARVQTGNAPDGVGYDAIDKILATSDQSPAAASARRSCSAWRPAMSCSTPHATSFGSPSSGSLHRINSSPWNRSQARSKRGSHCPDATVLTACEFTQTARLRMSRAKTMPHWCASNSTARTPSSPRPRAPILTS